MAELIPIDKINKKYNQVIKYINSTYAKKCEELSDLLVSLYVELDKALYSGVETIFNDYTAVYPDCLALNYVLQKNNLFNSFDIKKTIPDSYFSSIEIKKTSSIYWVKPDLANKKIEKVTSSCQEYFDSVFKSAKIKFFIETEKCKKYYLEQLLEFQEIIKEKLSSAKQIEQETLKIEQEIMIFKTKIECLDELQNEINRLIKG